MPWALLHVQYACPLPIAHCSLPIAHCPLPIACCPLPIAHCLLPIAHCLLPIAHCPLPIVHCPPYSVSAAACEWDENKQQWGLEWNVFFIRCPCSWRSSSRCNSCWKKLAGKPRPGLKEARTFPVRLDKTPCCQPAQQSSLLARVKAWLQCSVSAPAAIFGQIGRTTSRPTTTPHN